MRDIELLMQLVLAAAVDCFVLSLIGIGGQAGMACLDFCLDESRHIRCAAPQIRFFTVLRAPEAQISGVVLCLVLRLQASFLINECRSPAGLASCLFGVKTSNSIPPERMRAHVSVCVCVFVFVCLCVPVPHSKGQ